ncbi:MAG: CPBP family intramembrane metalloprotease [Pirellula sp.]|nr:CPBP family intramembrane metalloprotease [Pirellula sp.]
MTPVSLTPVQILASLATAGLLLAILAGSIVCWALWFSGRRLKSTATGPQATIGLIDVAMTIVVLFMLISLAVTSWRTIFNVSERENIQVVRVSEQQPATETETVDATEAASERSEAVDVAPAKKELTEKQFLFSGFAITTQLICVFLMTGFICARTGCSLKRLGWRSDQCVGDLLAGLQCFLMVTPPLFLFNAILVQFTEIPYEHPIQKMLEQYPWLLGVAFWQASIVAPISEEFAFRTLLIGWFESIHYSGNKISAWMFGLQESKPNLGTRDHIDVSSPKGAASPIAVHSNLDLSPAVGPYAVEPLDPPAVSIASSAQESATSKPFVPPWWPAILSGVFFGLAHFSYGVSWVNLILFGIVLGRLYQIRQSLIPVILVHMLFNSLSIALFGLKILMPNTMAQ